MRTLAAALVVLLAAPTLAGCIDVGRLSGSRPPGALATSPVALACFGSATNLSVSGCDFDATGAEHTGNEVSIAVNPRDPLNMLAAAKDYTPLTAGNCVWDGYYVTKDGGRTWKQGHVPGSNWARLAGEIAEPVTPLSKYWCATDPKVAFGPDGTAYYAVMGYQCDAASASPIGAGTIPPSPVSQGGGINDFAFTCSGMVVMVSHDGGLTWPTDGIAEVAPTGPGLPWDKEWIAVDPRDARSVYFVSSFIPSYLAGDSGFAFSASHDGGATWSPPKTISDLAGDNEKYVASGANDSGASGAYAEIVVGSDGRLFVTWEGARDLWFVTSSDKGTTWSAPRSIEKLSGPGVLQGSTFRVSASPSLAIDDSGGPRDGALYVTWMQGVGAVRSDGTQETDIEVAHSTDGGKTWSTPARVNDDALANAKDQFLAAISVGPDGIVDVSWEDRRDDPANHLFHTYYADSTDGGVSFSPNLRVTDVASDEKYSHHQSGATFLGDYRDSDSSEGAAHFVWVDTRESKASVFVATVLRGPGAAGAIPPGANAGLLAPHASN